MSRDQGPHTVMRNPNGGNTITDGVCLPPRNQPQPTDGGDWTPFDKIGEAIFWAGTVALVVALFSLGAAATIFFFS